MTGLAAVVLSAGEGRRLLPLTRLRPKPLCPLGGDRTLLDAAFARVELVVPLGPDTVALNAHHLVEQVAAAAEGRAYLSVEQPQALGTAGAIGRLSEWRDGRDVLVVNADAVIEPLPDIAGLVDGWDRMRPRLLVVADPGRADFEGRWRFAGVSLLPAAAAATLRPVPSGLYETVWRHAELDPVQTGSEFVDCADPAGYLAGNLLATGGASAVASDAVVEGDIERCVVWPGARVEPNEHLADCIRAVDLDGTALTVPARRT